MGRARTLLVSINDDFLDGVADWVADDARIEVVGRAHHGSQALQRAGSLRAELVLVDVTLPDMSGFEFARRIKSRPGAPLVILLSFHDSHAARVEARAAGADGFVSKSEMADRLLPLIGDLLRQRISSAREKIPGFPTLRVPPTNVSK